MDSVINHFHSKKPAVFLYGMDSERNDSSFVKLMSKANVFYGGFAAVKLNFYSFFNHSLFILYSFFKPKNIKT
jgi:hypothetical protein